MGWWWKARAKAPPPGDVTVGDVTIRRAHPADSDEIAGTLLAAWEETYRGLTPAGDLDGVTPAALADRMRLSLADPEAPGVLYVALRQGRIVGFVLVGPVGRPCVKRSDGEVAMLYLLRAAQRRGIGRLLMRQAAATVQAEGGRSLCVWVASDNHPACRFYEALGGKLVDYSAEVDRRRAVGLVAYRWRNLRRLLS